MDRVLKSTLSVLVLMFAQAASAQAVPFVRGDANQDESTDLSDGISVLLYLFQSGGLGLTCLDTADSDDSGELDITDAIYLFNHLFLGGPALPPPVACGEDPTPDALDCLSSTCPPEPSGLPAAYSRFVDSVEISVDGQFVVLHTNGVPNHPSPYFPTSDPLYEPPHAGMVVNPNRIRAQNLELRIPLHPAPAPAASDTRLGPIGIATNGVALFNQYAGPNVPLDREIATFDRLKGHPQMTGMYHYHVEPLFLTMDDPAVLVGFLLDGFPIYGPREADGSLPAGLDACNGHTHATADYPDGIYHYHVVPNPPYLVGCYKGTPGQATN